MSDVSTNKRKSVMEVHFQSTEVSELLLAAALERVNELPGVTHVMADVRTYAARSDKYGGFIIDVVVEEGTDNE